MVVQPDGAWVFTPPAGGLRSTVLNHGRLTAAQHARLAALLAALPAAPPAGTPAGPVGGCPGRDRYRLTAGALDLGWTDCDSPTGTALAELVALIGSVAPL
ncbi:MAG TPA: hypothetical protein VFE14_11930 [Micromonosporaceae bacterium]|nr:hypothetical protein [Micromonosporaceae bacterium]